MINIRNYADVERNVTERAANKPNLKISSISFGSLAYSYVVLLRQKLGKTLSKEGGSAYLAQSLDEPKSISTQGVSKLFSRVDRDLGYKVASDFIHELSSDHSFSEDKGFLGSQNSNLQQENFESTASYVPEKEKHDINIEKVVPDKSAATQEHSDLEYIRNQSQQFEKMTESLLDKGLGGRYVLFRDGVVLDSSKDELELVMRSYKKYKDEPLFIKKVSEELEAAATVWTPFFD